MRKTISIIFFSIAVFAWEYWVPYCNTLHISGEVSWRSSLSIYALWDSTDIRIEGFIDTLLQGGEHFEINDFTACGTHIISSKPVQAIYSTKIVTASEYESTEYSYCLIPAELLGTEYYVSALHTPYASHEYIAFSSTTDDNDVYFDGVFLGTYDAGECDTVHFADEVAHIESSSPIALVHIGARTSEHDDFFGYSILPTNRSGVFYTSAPMPELWETGYSDPEDSSRIVITGLEDGTTVNIDGTIYSLNSGEKIIYLIGTSEYIITADKPIQVVRYYWIVATDPWVSSARRWYTAATLMASDSAATKCGYIFALSSSSHGGPKKWYTLTSLKNNNEITIDIGFDNIIDLDTTLDSLETLVFHDTISILDGGDTMSSLIKAQKEIQFIYEQRGWWTYRIGNHKKLYIFCTLGMRHC